MGITQKVALLTILLITELQHFSDGVSVRRQVARQVQKKIKGVEERLMTSIADACHKQVCTSGILLIVHS